MENINMFLQNKNVTAVISLLLALYSGLAAPSLPNKLIEFFDTIPGKLLFIFTIAFITSKNVEIGMMMAVAFTVTLSLLNKENFSCNQGTISEIVDKVTERVVQQQQQQQVQQQPEQQQEQQEEQQEQQQSDQQPDAPQQDQVDPFSGFKESFFSPAQF